MDVSLDSNGSQVVSEDPNNQSYHEYKENAMYSTYNQPNDKLAIDNSFYANIQTGASVYDIPLPPATDSSRITVHENIQITTAMGDFTTNTSFAEDSIIYTTNSGVQENYVVTSMPGDTLSFVDGLQTTAPQTYEVVQHSNLEQPAQVILNETIDSQPSVNSSYTEEPTSSYVTSMSTSMSVDSSNIVLQMSEVSDQTLPEEDEVCQKLMASEQIEMASDNEQFQKVDSSIQDDSQEPESTIDTQETVTYQYQENQQETDSKYEIEHVEPAQELSKASEPEPAPKTQKAKGRKRTPGVPWHILGVDMTNGQSQNKSRLGVKIPGKNLASQIVSNKDIQEEVIRSAREKQREVELQYEQDVFATRLQQRLASKIIPGGGSSPFTKTTILSTPLKQDVKESITVIIEDSVPETSKVDEPSPLPIEKEMAAPISAEALEETSSNSASKSSASVHDNSDLIALLEGDGEDIPGVPPPQKKKDNKEKLEDIQVETKLNPKQHRFFKSKDPVNRKSEVLPRKEEKSPTRGEKSAKLPASEPRKYTKRVIEVEPQIKTNMVLKTYTRKRKSSETSSLVEPAKKAMLVEEKPRLSESEETITLPTPDPKRAEIETKIDFETPSAPAYVTKSSRVIKKKVIWDPDVVSPKVTKKFETPKKPTKEKKKDVEEEKVEEDEEMPETTDKAVENDNEEKLEETKPVVAPKKKLTKKQIAENEKKELEDKKKLEETEIQSDAETDEETKSEPQIPKKKVAEPKKKPAENKKKLDAKKPTELKKKAEAKKKQTRSTPEPPQESEESNDSEEVYLPPPGAIKKKAAETKKSPETKKNPPGRKKKQTPEPAEELEEQDELEEIAPLPAPKKKVGAPKKGQKRLTEVDRLLRDEGAVNMLYDVKTDGEEPSRVRRKDYFDPDKVHKDLRNKAKALYNDLVQTSNDESTKSLRKKEPAPPVLKKETPPSPKKEKLEPIKEDEALEPKEEVKTKKLTKKDMPAPVSRKISKDSRSSAQSPPPSPGFSYSEASMIIRRHSSSSFSSACGDESVDENGGEKRKKQHRDGVAKKKVKKELSAQEKFEVSEEMTKNFNEVTASSSANTNDVGESVDVKEKEKKSDKAFVFTKKNKHANIDLKYSSNDDAFLTLQMLKELTSTIKDVAKSKDCTVLSITSSHSTYCLGLDYKSLVENDEDLRQKHGGLVATAVKEFLKCLLHFPKVLVAGIQGDCVGLGVTMLPLFDIIVACDGATFSTPYARLGCIPEGANFLTTPFLSNNSLASELLLTPQKIKVDDAFRRGLVSKLFWPEKFQTELKTLLAGIAQQSTVTIENTKKILRHKQLLKEVDESLNLQTKLMVDRWISPECQKQFANYSYTK